MHFPKYVTPAYRTNPLSAIAAGKTGEPQTITAVGGTDAAASKLVFSGIFVNGDTFTVGGKVFTAKTSGAAGYYQFNITGALSTDIDALIAVLQAAPDNTLKAFTFTKADTNTSLTATPKLGSGSNGNTTVGTFTSTHSTTTPTRQAGGVEAPVVSLDTETTIINNATGGKYTVGEFLAFGEGDEGQDKNIWNIGAGAAALILDVAGGTTLTLDQDEGCCLTYLGGKWRPVYNTGAIT